MLRILFALLTLLPGLAAAGTYPYSYETVKVAEGIFAFIEPRGHAVVSGNTLLIVGEDAAALIDTGHHPPLARKIAAEIRALTSKPLRYIVNTHWHNDHVAGNSVFAEAFPQAQVVMHAFTSEVLDRDVRPFMSPRCAATLRVQTKVLQDMLASGKGSDGTPLTDARRKRLEGFIVDADAAVADCDEFRYKGADATFTDRMTLRLGKRDVELIHPGRANTAGDVIAWIPDAKVLASGDIIVYPFPYATQSFISEWVAVLKKLDAMPFETLVPGHGPVMKDRNYLHLVADTFEAVMARSRALYKPGMTSEELRKAIDLKDVRARIAGDDAIIGLNFDNMVGNLAVTRAWEELRGRFEPEGLKLP